MVAIPYLMQQHHATSGKENLLISHVTTSSCNPVSWQAFFDHMVTYQNRFPYENRTSKAQMTVHDQLQNYNFSYKFKNKLPVTSLYYLTRIVGTKKFSNSVSKLRQAVDNLG